MRDHPEDAKAAGRANGAPAHEKTQMARAVGRRRSPRSLDLGGGYGAASYGRAWEELDAERSDPPADASPCRARFDYGGGYGAAGYARAYERTRRRP